MSRVAARVGEGKLEDSSSKFGVYNFFRDLILEGKDARLVNNEGRFVVNWPKAVERYEEYRMKSRKNHEKVKSRNMDKRKASNALRASLLNHYKKEGAKEFKESKKVNENDDVIERQFQMPPKVFKSLFEGFSLTNDSEQDGSSALSEDEENETALAVSNHGSPHSSDTGFDEPMDLSDPAPSSINMDHTFFNENVEGFQPDEDFQPVQCNEENSLGDLTPPSQMFQISEEEFDSALKDIISDTDGISENDILDLSGVVQGICPSSGSVKGGQPFQIPLSNPLPDDVISGLVTFEGCGTVFVDKLNCSTLRGFLPSSQQPGSVIVTVETLEGQYLGNTSFLYVDEVQDMLRQLVKDPVLQSMFFHLWAQENGVIESRDEPEPLNPFIMPTQGSSVQSNSARSVDILQLLVYTAAQTDAQQFIHMIFSTSAGKVVFDSYKGMAQLPEDVARANGHEELALQLEDITRRFSEQDLQSNIQSDAIDWLELVHAVEGANKQSSADKVLYSQEIDDNISNYFADVDTSSCCSCDLDTNWSDSEDKGTPAKGRKSWFSVWEQDSSPLKATDELDTSVFDMSLLADSGGEIRVGNHPRTSIGYRPGGVWSRKWLKKSIDEAASVTTERKGVKSKGPVAAKHSSKSTRIKYNSPVASQNTSVVLCAVILIMLLTGFKMNENWILHWAVEHGHMQFANVLVRCGSSVNYQNSDLRIPLHLAAQQGNMPMVKLLLDHGSKIDAGDFFKQIPLYLAVTNAYREIVQKVLRSNSNVLAKDLNQQTPLHLAAQNGHKQIAELLLQYGADFGALDVMQQTPLHLAAQNGHIETVKLLLQHGAGIHTLDLNGAIPLQLALQNGHLKIVEILLQHDIHNGQKFMYLAGVDAGLKVVDITTGALVYDGRLPTHFLERNHHQQTAKNQLQSDVTSHGIYACLGAGKDHNQIAKNVPKDSLKSTGQQDDWALTVDGFKLWSSDYLGTQYEFNQTAGMLFQEIAGSDHTLTKHNTPYLPTSFDYMGTPKWFRGQCKATSGNRDVQRPNLKQLQNDAIPPRMDVREEVSIHWSVQHEPNGNMTAMPLENASHYANDVKEHASSIHWSAQHGHNEDMADGPLHNAIFFRKHIKIEPVVCWSAQHGHNEDMADIPLVYAIHYANDVKEHASIHYSAQHGHNEDMADITLHNAISFRRDIKREAAVNSLQDAIPCARDVKEEGSVYWFALPRLNAAEVADLPPPITLILYAKDIRNLLSLYFPLYEHGYMKDLLLEENTLPSGCSVIALLECKSGISIHVFRIQAFYSPVTVHRRNLMVSSDCRLRFIGTVPQIFMYQTPIKLASIKITSCLERRKIILCQLTNVHGKRRLHWESYNEKGSFACMQHGLSCSEKRSLACMQHGLSCNEKGSLACMQHGLSCNEKGSSVCMQHSLSCSEKRSLTCMQHGLSCHEKGSLACMQLGLSCHEKGSLACMQLGLSCHEKGSLACMQLGLSRNEKGSLACKQHILSCNGKGIFRNMQYRLCKGWKLLDTNHRLCSISVLKPYELFKLQLECISFTTKRERQGDSDKEWSEELILPYRTTKPISEFSSSSVQCSV